MFTANAVDPQRHLLLEEELRVIKDALKRSRLRDHYALSMSPAASFSEVIHDLDDRQPTIAHFSGHGDRSGNIILKGAAPHPDKEHHVAPEHMAELLDTLPHPPTLVTFALCHSTALAKAASEHAQYAIGFDGPLEDASVPLFSATLYERLASNAEIDVPRAFRLARLACLASGHESVELARLFERPGGKKDRVENGMNGNDGDGAGGGSGAPVEQQLVDELARVFWDPQQAKMFAVRVGIQRQDMPQFQNSGDFWMEIALQADDRGIPGGLKAFGKAAAAQYPGNATFKRYL